MIAAKGAEPRGGHQTLEGLALYELDDLHRTATSHILTDQEGDEYHIKAR